MLGSKGLWKRRGAQPSPARALLTCEERPGAARQLRGTAQQHLPRESSRGEPRFQKPPPRNSGCAESSRWGGTAGLQPGMDSRGRGCSQPVFLPMPPLPPRRFAPRLLPGVAAAAAPAPVPAPPGKGAAHGSTGGSRLWNYRGQPRAFSSPGARRSIPISALQLSPLPEPAAELELAPSQVLRGAGLRSGSKTPESSFFLHPLRCAGIIYIPQTFCKGNFSLQEGYSWDQDTGTSFCYIYIKIMESQTSLVPEGP